MSHWLLVISHWEHWWIGETSSKKLVFFRRWLGVFLLIYAGLYIPHLTMLFSSEGLVLPLYDQPLPSPLTVHILYALLIASIIAFAFGRFYRVTTLLIILLGCYFWQLQMHLFPASYNRILLLTMIVMLFAGADGKRERISILPQRLIMLQITFTFLGVSLQKWWLPDWQSGEVLGYSMISRWATPISFWIVQRSIPIEYFDWMVLSVKTIQPLAAVGVWIPKIRLMSSVYLIMFLILVGALLSIWWFVFLIPAFIFYWEGDCTK